jgi:hypothetical protein
MTLGFSIDLDAALGQQLLDIAVDPAETITPP